MKIPLFKNFFKSRKSRKPRAEEMSLFSKITKSSWFFWTVVFLILTARWTGWDHFVVPSSSMVPTFLVYDHIVVKKYPYGLRVPFTKKWLNQKRLPHRGEVVVFRSVQGSYFMLKRVIGLPGDHLKITEGEIWINGEKQNRILLNEQAMANHYPISSFEVKDDIESYHFFLETLGTKQFRILQKKGEAWSQPYDEQIPEGHLFVMGDNRDNSQDSRYWGFLPVENLMGEAVGIWLSCDKVLFGIPILCYPWTLRWKRLFSSLKEDQ